MPTNSEKLKRLLRFDVVMGGLMLLPLLMSIIPNSVFEITIGNDINTITIVVALMVWTMFFTWLMRLRKINNYEVKISVLILIAGQVNVVFFLGAALGLGVMTVALAPMIPFSLSRPHVDKIQALIQE